MALESIAVSVALGGVKLLLKEVLEEVGKPWWESDKNAEVLRRLLQCISPVISDMDTPGATPQQVKWLEEVEPCLEDINQALINHKKSRVLGKFGTSRELVQKVERLRELCQSEVPIMTMYNSNEILRELSSMGKDLMMMKEQMKALELGHDTNFQELQQVSEMPSSSRLQDTYTTFGADHDMIVEKTIQKLLQDSKNLAKDDLESVGIWGLGGSGKTLAAQRIYNKKEIQAHFRGGCYWLTVGNAKTSIPNLLREMWEKMVNSRPSKSRDEDIKNDLFTELQGRERMLLVLDDVWMSGTLEILDAMPKGAQCKALITTRNKSVLNRKHATEQRMPTLSAEDSWKLFCHHAWCSDADMPSGLEEVGKLIAGKCGELPLALKVIGGHLAGNDDPSYWEHILQKLKNAETVSSDVDEQLYAKLELSIMELEKVHPRLKDCFFYFASFPEDYVVWLENLFPLWLGDQIVGNNSNYDVKREAQELLNMLVQRSLIEIRIEKQWEIPGPDEKVYVVQRVLRDLIKYILQKLPKARRDCLYEAGVNLKELPEEYHKILSGGGGSLSARCLSVMSSHVYELPRKLLNAPKLRVMILQHNPVWAISGDFFRDNFPDLRVLDLSATRIERLPKTVQRLKELVVLNLSRSYVKELPWGIFKAMTNLRVLNVAHCNYLEYLPSSITFLSRLEYLDAVSSGNSIDHWRKARCYDLGRRGTLANLMSLVSLRELRITGKSVEVLPDGIFKALIQLRVLHLFDFCKLVAMPEPVEDELQHLQVLTLGYCASLTSLPDSFGIFLKNLQVLNLHGCKSLKSVPGALAALLKLEYFDIIGCSKLEGFPVSFTKPGAFLVLKDLHMGSLEGFGSFPDLQPGAMPRLEYLDLLEWDQLVDFPKPIANLTNLRTLNFTMCSKLRNLEHEGVGVQSLANLEALHLNGIEGELRLPGGLEELPHLRLIDITRSRNVVFSQELSHLVKRP